MNNIETYIENHTRNGSNQVYYHNHYFTNGTNVDLNSGIEVTYSSWLTPDDARNIAKIAKNEVIEKAVEWLDSVRLDYYAEHIEECLKDFRKAMEE